MKIRFISLGVVILGCVFSAHAIAANDTAPAAPAAAPATGLSAELMPVVTKIKTKLAAGSRKEEDFAAELKEFDAVIAAHRGEKTDEVAQAALLQAGLYLQVFENFDKGSEMLNRITKDFPDTQTAGQAKSILGKLDLQKEAMKTQAALKPGAVFPDFAEKDLSGAPLSLGQFKKKVILVDFWATWCGPCVGELPNVLAAYKKYHAKGFEIVGISLDQSETALKDFIKQKEMTWPQYFDGKGWESKLGQKYGITSIPATFLLDGEGKIVAKNLRGPALEAELAKLLGE
jgi:thiol-disulfide isomerase/thioredoxin